MQMYLYACNSFDVASDLSEHSHLQQCPIFAGAFCKVLPILCERGLSTAWPAKGHTSSCNLEFRSHTDRKHDARCDYLKEADEVGQHHAVDAGQGLHDVDGGRRVLEVGDALRVELGGDERLVQLAVPQLEQRRRDVRVRAVGRRVPLVAAHLERVHLVDITGNPARTNDTHRVRHFDSCAKTQLSWEQFTKFCATETLSSTS